MWGRRNLSKWFDEAKREGNPYLTEWFAAATLGERFMANLFTDLPASIELRRLLVRRYAWAVPCEAALDLLASLAPLIEVGAGTGYWAWLLRKKGVDVKACDLYPPPHQANHWHGGVETWTVIDQAGPEVLKEAKGRTLFLCWPPCEEPMALECLRAYQGNRLVLIGEGSGGCTACEKFWEELESAWKQTADVELPQFDGPHDYLSVWEK